MEAEADKQLDDGLAKLFNVTPGMPGIDLDAIRQKAASSLANYGKLVSEALALQNIDVPPPVHLQWWAEGSRIKVLADHPEAQRIEIILNGVGDIVGKFKELELLHEILRNTELAGESTTDGQHFNVGITSSGTVAFFTE